MTPTAARSPSGGAASNPDAPGSPHESRGPQEAALPGGAPQTQPPCTPGLLGGGAEGWEQGRAATLVILAVSAAWLGGDWPRAGHRLTTPDMFCKVCLQEAVEGRGLVPASRALGAGDFPSPGPSHKVFPSLEPSPSHCVHWAKPHPASQGRHSFLQGRPAPDSLRLSSEPLQTPQPPTRASTTLWFSSQGCPQGTGQS